MRSKSTRHLTTWKYNYLCLCGKWATEKIVKLKDSLRNFPHNKVPRAFNLLLLALVSTLLCLSLSRLVSEQVARADNLPPEAIVPVAQSNSVTFLSDLAWSFANNGWGPVELDRSNGEDKAGDGRTLTINGTTYQKGLGVHAASEIRYSLGGQYTTFTSDVGVDDEMTSGGTVVFQVWADGVKLYDSGVVRHTDSARSVNVSVTGRGELKLVVTNGGDGETRDHADWAGARLIN